MMKSGIFYLSYCLLWSHTQSLCSHMFCTLMTKKNTVSGWKCVSFYLMTAYFSFFFIWELLDPAIVKGNLKRRKVKPALWWCSDVLLPSLQDQHTKYQHNKILKAVNHRWVCCWDVSSTHSAALLFIAWGMLFAKKAKEHCKQILPALRNENLPLK